MLRLALVLALATAPHPTAVVRTSPHPAGIVAAYGAVWTATDTGTLERIDPRRNRVTHIRVGRNAFGLTAAFGSLWVTRWDPSEVVRVDPRTRRMVRIALPRGAGDIAATRDAVWVSSYDSSSVTRIEPVSNRIVETVPVGRFAADIAVLGDTLWIGTGRTSRDVLRLDLRTRRLTPVPVGQLSPTSIVAARRDGVWVTTGEDMLVRIDPATNAVVATLRMPATPQRGTFAPDGTLWVASKEANVVTRVDTGRNRVIDSTAAGPGALDVASAFGSLWVPSYAGSSVLRFSAR